MITNLTEGCDISSFYEVKDTKDIDSHYKNKVEDVLNLLGRTSWQDFKSQYDAIPQQQKNQNELQKESLLILEGEYGVLKEGDKYKIGMSCSATTCIVLLLHYQHHWCICHLNTPNYHQTKDSSSSGLLKVVNHFKYVIQRASDERNKPIGTIDVYAVGAYFDSESSLSIQLVASLMAFLIGDSSTTYCIKSLCLLKDNYIKGPDGLCYPVFTGLGVSFLNNQPHIFSIATNDENESSFLSLLDYPHGLYRACNIDYKNLKLIYDGSQSIKGMLEENPIQLSMKIIVPLHFEDDVILKICSTSPHCESQFFPTYIKLRSLLILTFQNSSNYWKRHGENDDFVQSIQYHKQDG